MKSELEKRALAKARDRWPGMVRHVERMTFNAPGLGIRFQAMGRVSRRHPEDPEKFVPIGIVRIYG